MKEYGSNIQKLTDHIKTIKDREKRTLYANIMVELMRQIHPNMRDNQDYSNKLWDDLYIISNFELDVDSPFPPPSEEALGKKPLTVAYNQHSVDYKHYGHNLKLLVEKAIETEDKEDRLAFVSYLFRLMRSFYSTWNKDNVEDAVLLQQLEILSRGKLKEELEYIKTQGPIESSPKDRNSGGDRNNRGNQQLIGYQSQTNFAHSQERDRNHQNHNRNKNNGKFFNRNNNNNNTNNGNSGNNGNNNRNYRRNK